MIKILKSDSTVGVGEFLALEEYLKAKGLEPKVVTQENVMATCTALMLKDKDNTILDGLCQKAMEASQQISNNPGLLDPEKDSSKEETILVVEPQKKEPKNEEAPIPKVTPVTSMLLLAEQAGGELVQPIRDDFDFLEDYYLSILDYREAAELGSIKEHSVALPPVEISEKMMESKPDWKDFDYVENFHAAMGWWKVKVYGTTHTPIMHKQSFKRKLRLVA